MSATVRPVVVVGSINMDVVVRTQHLPRPGETLAGTDFQLHPGGKGANQAVAVARLGQPVHMVGRVGDDAFGAELRRALSDAGVDTEAVLTTDGPSGVASITVSEEGDNSIVVVPGANAYLSPDDLNRHAELIEIAGVVLTQLEVPLETVLHLGTMCTKAGVPLVLDPAPARSLPSSLLQNCTWFTPNETEAAFFAAGTAAGDEHATAEALLAMGPRNVLLKLGSRGAYVMTAEGTGRSVSSLQVNAVDTTAAGDCFNGAFATALLHGKDALSAAEFAAVAAAISVTRAGAQSSMPTLHEVELGLLGRTA